MSEQAATFPAIKAHRTGTLDGLRARAVCKRTVARWIDAGDIQAIENRRPMLLLSAISSISVPGDRGGE